MSLTKKLLIVFVILAVIIAAVIVYILIIRNQPPSRIFPPSPPTIPTTISQQLPITTTLTAQDLTYPSKLPILIPSSVSISKQNALSVASNFGFTSEPIEARDVSEGVKYIWSDQEKYLSITPQTKKVEYGLQNIPRIATPTVTDDQISQIATDFLARQFNTDINNWTVSQILYIQSLREEDVNITQDRSRATIFQVNFQPAYSQYEIVELNPSTPSVYVQVLRDGTISKAEVLVTGPITAGAEEYSLISPDEVLKSLNTIKLVSITNTYITLPDLTVEDFESIKLTQFKVAYYKESPTATYYQPIFILSGPATIKGRIDSPIADFYLPAIKY